MTFKEGKYNSSFELEPVESTEKDEKSLPHFEFEHPKNIKQTPPPRPPLLFSSRFALCIISCLGFLNLYALRVNLSVAMVCMVNQTALQESVTNSSDSSVQRPATCSSGLNDTDDTEDDSDGEFVWSKEIQGYVLGSFFWGYMLTQILGGWLAARYGGKRVYGYFMLVCAVSTLMMPISARTDYKLLMATRMIAGLSQGVVWPSMAVIWTKWAPPQESGTLTGICYAGSQIGNVVTFPVAAILCEDGFDGGWASVFYVLGSAGVLWFLAWMWIVADTPEEHPRVSDAEKVYICHSLESKTEDDQKPKPPVPWTAIFTSTPVWAMIITHTCANWGTYTFLTNIPSYMNEVLYFDVKKNGLLSALPYIGFGAAISVSGALFDLVLIKRWFSRTVARKIGNTIGLLVPGLFVIGVGYMDCNQPIQAVTLLVIGVAASGFQYGAGFLTNPGDLAPQFAGVIFGISNTFATVSGIMAPIVIGLITENQTQSEWQTVFFICAAIYIFGALVYILFGSSEAQPWAQEANYQDQVLTVKGPDSKNPQLFKN